MKLKVIVVNNELQVEGDMPEALRQLVEMNVGSYGRFQAGLVYRNSKFEWTIGYVMYSLYHLVEIANNERW
jgi:hypothetical protein